MLLHINLACMPFKQFLPEIGIINNRAISVVDFFHFTHGPVISRFWSPKVLNHLTESITSSTNKYIHLTLKMTSSQVVETSVTNSSSFQNYPHPYDHTIECVHVMSSNSQIQN